MSNPQPSSFCASSSHGTSKNLYCNLLADNSFSQGVTGGSSNGFNSSFIICKSTTDLSFPLPGLTFGFNSSLSKKQLINKLVYRNKESFNRLILLTFDVSFHFLLITLRFFRRCSNVSGDCAEYILTFWSSQRCKI